MLILRMKHDMTGESQHKHVWKDNFKILNGNYKSSMKRKEISEALYSKSLTPTLNVKEKLIGVKLRNIFCFCGLATEQL